MSAIIEHTPPLVVALVFSLAMTAAWGIAWHRGRLLPAEPIEDPGIKFTDAALALLGLLLAFTFSLSLTRHDQRRAMMVAESTAIGDFYTCASLLKEPYRSQLRGVLREYAERKLDLANKVGSDLILEEGIDRFHESQARMTAIVHDALAAGTPIAISLTNTLNGVTSSDVGGLAAYRERLPWSILLLLLLGCVVPAFLMGLRQASRSKPHLSGTVCFVVMVTFVVYVTLDLNQPQKGRIRVSQEPLERLLRSMD